VVLSVGLDALVAFQVYDCDAGRTCVGVSACVCLSVLEVCGAFMWVLGCD
jgi:hypothetical protein